MRSSQGAPQVVDLTGDGEDDDYGAESRQHLSQVPRISSKRLREPELVVHHTPTAEITIISSEDEGEGTEANRPGAPLVSAPPSSPLDRLLALPLEPGTIFDTLASTTSSHNFKERASCADPPMPRGAGVELHGDLRGTAHTCSAKVRESLESVASSSPDPACVTLSHAKSNIFVARTQASRSAFYRGPSTAQVQRRERMTAKGLVIQRLPSDSVITDEGSIFDSFVVVHPDLSTDDVRDCVEEVRSDERVCRAAHPSIHAYRLNASASGGCAGTSSSEGQCERRRRAEVVEGSDDDGEQFASEKILRVLRDAKLTGVLVIVTRWFGGRLLGPRRFTHIAVVARRVLESNGFVPPL